MAAYLAGAGRGAVGGAVEITAPTLEERLDTVIARAADRLAANAALLSELGFMNAVLDEMQAGTRRPTLHLTDADLEACENEQLGEGLVGLW